MELVLFENDNHYLKSLKQIIENHILFSKYECHLSLITSSVKELIDFTKNNRNKDCLYFLDIDSVVPIVGLDIASKIRELNPTSKIVILTENQSAKHLIFKYQIEILDYLQKQNLAYLKERIEYSIDNSINRFINSAKENEEYILFKSNNQFHKINISDIMYFESSYKPHRILVHLTNKQLIFYGNLRQISEKNIAFKKCHHSVIANINNIESIDFNERKLLFINGNTCYGSIRYLKTLKMELLNSISC